MRFWLKMTILGAAMATAAWGSACGTASYATYAGMSGGCTVGDETFSNFSALSISGTVGLTLPEADILITPEVAGGVDELVFSYQSLPSSNPGPTELGVGAGENFGYSFNFIVTPDPNPVIDIQMTSNIGVTGTGNVSAVKNVSTGGTVYTSSANNGLADFTYPSLVSGPVVSIPGTSAFTVQDSISLQGQVGTANQENFTNLFTEGAVSTATPEPATTLLIGTGLLCFGLTRKFRVRG